MGDGTSTRRFGWREVTLALLILFLAYQVVIPFVMIIWTSLKTARPGEAEFLDLTFTLANYARAFGSPSFWRTTGNTLSFALAATLLAFVLGAFIAWVVERTNTPLARIIGFMLVGRIVIPGILIAISWILIASPNIGLFNQMVLKLTGVRNVVNIYSFWGMVWVQALEMVPLIYLLLAAAFQAMDPRLEEASTMTGAGNWRTLRRISFPLALPAIGAALLLLFVTAIETFEVPLLMGTRAGVRVYTTEIFYDTSRTPIDWGLAATYSISLLLVAIALLLIYFRLIRHGDRYQTITGKDYRPRRIDLGPWRYVTCALAMLLVFLITGVPFLMMLYASLLPFYQAPTVTAFESMSLANYSSLFHNTKTITPMINSMILGPTVATAVILIVALIAYFVQKTQVPGRKILDFLAFAPIAIPSVVLGATFFWFYLLVPLPLIGTLTIIGLAYLTKYMPVALRFVSASMMAIHSELDEAAQVAGVSWARNFFKVVLPLLKPGLLAAWFWVMVHAYRELTVALMLARSQNRTAAVVIFDLWEEGSFLLLSAFGVLMFMLLMALSAIAYSVSRRFGVQEQVG
ncbi:MAG: iron(III) transport system permease protein [Alphaproteobacteria bacterium]|jgi:iron(III) transport system permease protein|nr:iron(III) transport system permease protein [Alphaproteobacteria bacterium]